MDGTANFGQRLRHFDHRMLWDYWCEKKPDIGVPARGDLDPLEMSGLLPRLALIDVEGDGESAQFRYRLVGTEIVERAGRDPTGQRFDELYKGDYLAQALATYRHIVATHEPYLSERSFPVESGRDFLRYDRLILPLARDHRQVDMLLLSIVFQT